MYDYNESAKAELFIYFFIYLLISFVFFIVSEMLFRNSVFTFLFFMTLGARLFSLSGDGFLAEDQRARSNARMERLLGRLWKPKYFPIPAFMLAVSVAIISNIFSLNEKAVIGVGQIAVLCYAVYIMVTKALLRR
jgi:hypothetical protein